MILESKDFTQSYVLESGPLNYLGSTPLHRSLELAKDYNISRILIENGADLCNRNVDGETPLHTHFSSVMEQVLLAHAYLLDYSVRDGRGKTLLHHLAWSSRTSRATFGRVSERSGRMNNVVDGEQRSVLHHAAQRGNIAIVDYILARRDSNINIKDKSGRTPLHYAIESSRSSAVIEILASNGADINAKDDGGWTALHLAAQRDKGAAIRALVGTGRSNDVLMDGCCGQNSLQTAKKNEAFHVLPNMAHAINLRPKGWPVSDQGSSSGREAPKTALDIRDSLEVIRWKELYFIWVGRYVFGPVSQQITPAGMKSLQKALVMLSCAVLLCGIWLIALGK